MIVKIVQVKEGLYKEMIINYDNTDTYKNLLKIESVHDYVLLSSKKKSNVR